MVAVRRAFPHWLYPGGEMQPWIDALRAIDNDGDKGPLIELLRDNARIPRAAKWYIADLLERYRLEGGKKRTPAYDLSRSVRQLEAAARSVRLQVKDGKRLTEALESAARTWGITDVETLNSHMQGRLGSSRKQKRRQAPASKPTS